MQRILLHFLDDIHRHKSVQCVLCQQVFKMQRQEQDLCKIPCVVKFSTLDFFPYAESEMSCFNRSM